MKRAIYGFCFICLNIYLTACGSAGNGPAIEEAPSTPAITQPPAAGVLPQTTIALTYHTLVVNAHVDQGGQSYPITMTGSCVSYGSRDYCWDDGWQSIPQIGFETDFWQLCDLNGVVGQCSGAGSSDPVADIPTLWSSMLAHLPTPTYQPSDVYAQGIATQVSCTLTGSVLDCIDFSVDTAQAPL